MTIAPEAPQAAESPFDSDSPVTQIHHSKPTPAIDKPAPAKSVDVPNQPTPQAQAQVDAEPETEAKAPEPVVYRPSPQVIALAGKYGFTMPELEAMGSDTAALITIGRIDARAKKMLDDSSPKPDPKPVKKKKPEPETDDDGEDIGWDVTDEIKTEYGDKLSGLLKSARGTIRKQQSANARLQQQVESLSAQIGNLVQHINMIEADEAFTAVGDEYAEVFRKRVPSEVTESDPEYASFSKVGQTTRALMEAWNQSGQPPRRLKSFIRDALKHEYGDKVTKKAVEKAVDEITQAAERQAASAIPRPSNRAAPPKSGREAAVAAVQRRIEESRNGSGVDKSW